MPSPCRAAVLLALLAVLPGAAAWAAAIPACPRDAGVLPLSGDIRGVHDPAIARDAGAYFLFATGPGIPLRRSNDLRHWTAAGTVFPSPVPDWAPDVIPGAVDVWAPDVSFFGGRFHLYYAVSTFASQHSAIGHATSVTLDPDAPGYAWIDHGPVITSETGGPWNAIDANVAIDDDGQPWITWGSFFGGVKLARLDAATGDVADGAEVYDLALRDPWYLGVEAPFLVRHDGWWYLFVSFGFCCRGSDSDYEVRVGRARDVRGPYVDDVGAPLMSNGGRLVLTGYGSVRGPGHNAVLRDGRSWWLVHHWYDAARNGERTLGVRALTWTRDGWPVVAGGPEGASFESCPQPLARGGR